MDDARATGAGEDAGSPGMGRGRSLVVGGDANLLDVMYEFTAWG